MVSSDNLYEVLVHDLSHEVQNENVEDLRRYLLMVKATSLLHLKRQRKTKSEASISVPQSQPATSTASGATSGATSTFPTSSSAPPASATGPRRCRPPGRGQGRPPVRRQPSDP
ncbi:hypothetical protein Bca101_051345 [Brassica carinata]